MHAHDAGAALPATAPQVLLAVTNSESMDGTTSGAIMVGSGKLSGTLAPLSNSSSPLSYTVPSGFVAPITQTTAGNSAPWTAYCSGTSGPLCDNGPSRMNMTKFAINQVVAAYSATINFAVYDYSLTGSTTPYNTWVYQMSPLGSAFTFTNTASTATPSTTVPNPCYRYTTFPTGTSSINADCAAFVSNGNFTSAQLNGNAYMNVSASSDNPQVNDVLYINGGSYDALFLDYGQVSPANPYPHPLPTSPPANGSYPLSTYNANGASGYQETYPSVIPGGNPRQTTPTNAGYVPFSQQVMYIKRGFGFNSSQSATSGNVAIDFTVDPTTSGGASTYASVLAPETNSGSTTEIKSAAVQSGIAGLLAGANSKLAGTTHATCQSQYVVLMTDGLPTLDLSGKVWPPLGTATANAYALTATFDSTGAFVSSNSQAVTDAVNAVITLKNAGVKTYVIGLGAGVNQATNPIAYQLLQAMAIAGGTANFFPANDPVSLANAFQVIVAQIYASSSVAAPLVPLSISNGSSDEYVATTTTSTGSAGHVTAFPVDASGNPTGGPVWSTDTTMTIANRTTKLLGGTSLATLSALPASAFNLTATPCIPSTTDTSVVVGFTINPGYTANGCSFLNGRAPASLLGAFSMQDSAHYLGPPSSGLLISRYPTYLAWARGLSARPASVLFTSSDGFLYSINASTGLLNWGWINTGNLKQLQNYSTFQAQGYTNGDFSVVDALDSGGTWSSYVVGSMNSGAEHFSLKLDSTGTPSAVVYDTTVTGTTAGDTPAATGNAPLRQPAVIAYVGNSAYTIYVVTSGTTSTLYEVNVATGAASSQALAFQVSSALFIDSSSNQVWLGGTNGTIWALTATGTDAPGDVSRIQQTGTSVNPANGSPVPNVQWVSYFKVNGIPYFYAANSGQITLFGVASTGWVPLWTATTAVNYTYTPPVPPVPGPARPGVWTQVTTAPNLLTSTGVVSDMPIVVGGVLLVPVFTPGTGCSLGQGYYDFFSITKGAFPTQALIDAGLTITADILVGPGPAFTPTVSIIATGYTINDGTANCTTLCGHQPGTNKITNTSISWRQH